MEHGFGQKRDRIGQRSRHWVKIRRSLLTPGTDAVAELLDSAIRERKLADQLVIRDDLSKTGSVRYPSAVE